MKVWLDNEKPAPAGWVWIRMQVELESILNAQVGQVHSTLSGDVTIEEITHISLDYELDPGCGDGLECAKIIAKGARIWAMSIRTSRNQNDITFLGIQPMLVLCHSNSLYAKKDVEKMIAIANEHWVIGLKELSVIQLANNLDAMKKSSITKV